MAKVTRHRFKTSYYEAGVPKYLAGKHYPPDAVTHAELIGGNVDEIEVDTEKENADGSRKAATPPKE
jgi:hypothetical protein